MACLGCGFFFLVGLFASSFSLPVFFFVGPLWPLLYMSCILSLFWSIYYSLSIKEKKKRRRKNGEYRLIWKNLKDQICETESGGSFLVKVALEFSVPLETRVLCLGSHLGEGLDVGLAKK